MTLQRPPRVRRFLESCLDDVEAGSYLETDPISATDARRPRNCSAPLILHFIYLERNTDPSLKLLRVSELPDGCVERLLPSSKAGSTKAVHFGLASRAVRWEPIRQAYVFNGRVGSPVRLVKIPSDHVINTTSFVPLHDQRSDTGVPEENNSNESVVHWRFKDGENPGIQRFLEGMGETEPEEPDAEPEIPADAAKFMNRSTLPGLTQIE